MTRAKSRTMRDVLEEKFMPNTWSEDIYQALKDIETLIKASKPEKESTDKTRKPVLKTVTKSVGVGILQTTTQDGENTYSEQDIEDAAYECAKPYLDAYEANLLKILGGE